MTERQYSGVSKLRCLRGETNRIRGRERRSVAILAVVFLLVFTSYISIQNLQSSINEEDGLGVMSLMCVYIAATISCVFAPLAIRVVSVKGVIIISCMVHLLYACSNFYPRFWTIIPTSVLLGSISGPFWTAQNMYTSTCSYIYAERCKKNAGQALSKFFSTFSVIFVWSNIIGNIMSSVLLNIGTESENNIFPNASVFLNTSLNDSGQNYSKIINYPCAVQYCPDFSGGKISTTTDSTKQYLYYLLGLFVACVGIAFGIAIIFLPPIPKASTNSQENVSVVYSITSCGRALRKPTLFLLCPSFLAYSWGEGFRWSDVSQVINMHLSYLYVSFDT